MPNDVATRLTAIRARVRRFTRRRRRPLAAALAGLGVLVALTSLRTPTAAVQPESQPPGQGLLRPGEAAVPIALSSPALVRTISLGSIVDIIGVPRDEGADPTVVVHGARVIDIPDGGSGISVSSTPVIVVAVDDADALPLVATSSRDIVGLVIRGMQETD